MAESRPIARIMADNDVAFGTSGARGLADNLSSGFCHALTDAFLGHLHETGQLGTSGRVCLGGDLRPSTPRIMRACAAAIRSHGLQVEYAGLVPSPTLALRGLSAAAPGIMVTGSHIPEDRNGIKFTTPAGEITKADEEGITSRTVASPPTAAAIDATPLPGMDTTAIDAYRRRYLDCFADQPLAGLSIGVYQHSSVARELLPELLQGLGATVTPLEPSERFVPVDTEAIRPEDVEKAERWAEAHGFDAVVSTDGDADRPLIADETGRWLRGDQVGILTARFLGIRGVATPVSSNSAVEASGWFERVLRTRIGSPHVIAGMAKLAADRIAPVGGYEANGGFLLQHDVEYESHTLEALPTRDAAMVIVAVLTLAARGGLRVSELMGQLPARATASDRLKAFPTDAARERIAALRERGDGGPFASLAGRLIESDETDGLRLIFDSGEIVHLRPSGNAPELRCYTEAGSEERARALNARCLEILEGWRAGAAET